MFSQQKACCKKGMEPGAKCNTKTAMTVNSQVDLADIKCNHPETEKCDPATCPRGAAEAKMQITTEVVTTTEAQTCDHKKSWWKFWKKQDQDCCKKVNP